ncbi:hypothetical protein CASFOL_012139 [Castilleja foliolosa]|uniref:MI domain-containing protein n=1 Tax=Castilleja foliolosa TaxID=1961234 RepID=A0ABD3DS04_9LAMI
MEEKGSTKSRRELRKESRLAKNKKKFDSWVQHHSKKPSSSGLRSKNSSEAISAMVDKPNSKAVNLRSSGSTKPKMDSDSKSKKGLKRKMDSDRTPKTNFFKLLEMEKGGQDASAEEDLRLEKKLAKKLKLKNGKLSSGKDDLSELLEGIPSALDNPGSRTSKKSNLVNDDLEDEISDDEGDEESDLLGSGDDDEDEESDLLGSGDDDVDSEEFDSLAGSEDDDDDNDDDMARLMPPSNSNKGKRKKRKSDIEGDDDDDDGLNMLVEGKSSEDKREQKVVTKVSSNIGTGKYVAPHLRSQVGNESVEYAQLRKRVRGLLNRLSETNVESITSEISNLIHSVGRSVGSQILSEEVITACSRGPRGNEQYAAVFAAFVSGMACSVGTDFSAKLLARLANCFEEEFLKEDNLSLRNLTLLFSYLYVFGICASELIYDFLIMLGKRLTEVDVSTVLTVLQCCGMKLRGDDPVGMRNFILSVQSRVKELKTSSENEQSNLISKRMEFMLETISDIKNNKKKSKEDTAQHTRIKKWLQKLRVDDVLLRGLTWNKLVDPNKKGQWWLSGDNASTTENVEEVADTIDKEITETKMMLELATSQRMNTDARRAIFCVIMTGEDYIDAFEKLLRLDLPGKQDREIMRVLVECCLQEKVFNKYYCVLASKLCSHDRNHKFTLQYCLWDHFKELDTMTLMRSMHLSKFTAEMIGSFSLSLAVLKAVELNDLTHLSPKRVMHFRMLFEAIFEFSDKLVWNIFTRIAVTSEYEDLRIGIEFFISNYVVNGKKSLAKKFKLAKKALNNVEGIVL